MAIRDFQGSNLGETFKSVSELAKDMQSNGYRIIEYEKNAVILDDGSKVDTDGNVSKVNIR